MLLVEHGKIISAPLSWSGWSDIDSQSQFGEVCPANELEDMCSIFQAAPRDSAL